LYLSHFDFRLTHKPGTANTQADPLSRFPSNQVSDADNNHQQRVLRPEHFASIGALAVADIDTLKHDIRNAADWDPEVILAL
jgi:hypothetical protein